MNKKLFFGIVATFTVAIAVVCTMFALNNSSSKYSVLQAANIEALTKGEPSEGTTCYTTWLYSSSSRIIECSVCAIVDGVGLDGYTSCTMTGY